MTARVAQSAVSVVCPVDADRVAEVEQNLATMAADVDGNPLLPLGRLDRTHFARLFLVPPEPCLSPEATDTLNLAVDKLKSGQFRAVLTGHADAQGSAETNQKIAKARAQAAADFLIGKGVSGSQIEIEGQGSDEPIATNTTATGRAQNRRVDVELIPR